MDTGNLSWRRFINEKQMRSKAKIYPPDGRVSRLKREHSTGGPKTTSINWHLWTRSVLGSWIDVSLISRDWNMCH
jgi:hypothetical protein